MDGGFVRFPAKLIKDNDWLDAAFDIAEDEVGGSAESKMIIEQGVKWVEFRKRIIETNG